MRIHFTHVGKGTTAGKELQVKVACNDADDVQEQRGERHLHNWHWQVTFLLLHDTVIDSNATHTMRLLLNVTTPPEAKETQRYFLCGLR